MEGNQIGFSSRFVDAHVTIVHKWMAAPEETFVKPANIQHKLYRYSAL
jgi:hypothetical protein